MPVIVNMDVTSSSCASHASLTARASRPIPAPSWSAAVARPFICAAPLSLLREEGATGPEVGAAGGGHGLGLRLDVRVLVCVNADYGLEDGQKLVVFRQGIRGGGDRGGGPDGELRFRGIGGEEGENVAVGERAVVRKHVLSGVG